MYALSSSTRADNLEITKGDNLGNAKGDNLKLSINIIVGNI